MSQSGMSPGTPMPPPPQWTPMPTQSSSVAIPWSAMVTLGRAAGFLLIFLGTLIAVAFASIPGGCITTPSSCTSFPSQLANAVWAGKILWVLGLFFIGGASGIRLHRRAPSGSSEDGAGAVQRHRANVLILAISILLLLYLFVTINASPFVTIP